MYMNIILVYHFNMFFTVQFKKMKQTIYRISDETRRYHSKNLSKIIFQGRIFFCV